MSPLYPTGPAPGADEAREALRRDCERRLILGDYRELAAIIESIPGGFDALKDNIRRHAEDARRARGVS